MTSEEETGQLSEQVAWEVGNEVVGTVVNELTKATAVVYGIDPELAAAFGGAAGGSLKGLTIAARQAYERRRYRANRALEAAEQYSGHRRNELLELALEDDRKLELLTSAVETAMRQADEQRVRFYGRIAATGVLAADDAHVDRAERVFSTIASFDAADVKVLLHVAHTETPNAWVVEPPKENRRASNVLSVDLPELADVLDSVLARLEAAGIVTMRSEGGMTFGTSYKVTEFARICVSELLAGGEHERDTN